MIYKKSKTGKIQQWSGYCDENVLTIEFGQVDGKKQIKTTVIKGKNSGKSNETSDCEQCEKELASQIAKRVDRKGYTFDKSGITDFIYPIKIKDFTKLTREPEYPVYVQLKYNGINGLFIFKEDGLSLISRGATRYEIPPHLAEPIATLMDKHNLNYLNVELYVHNTHLQLISSAVKKHNDMTKDLQAVIFDIPTDDNVYFEDTVKVLDDIKETEYIKVAKPVKINSKKELTDFYKKALLRGYEGIVIKLLSSKYVFNTRSNTRWKLKPVQSKEFKVVDFNLDKNGNPVLVCETNGSRFNVNPKGTFEFKQELLKELPSRLGDYYSVEFEEFSIDGIPLKPIGQSFRDMRDGEVIE